MENEAATFSGYGSEKKDWVCSLILFCATLHSSESGIISIVRDVNRMVRRSDVLQLSVPYQPFENAVRCSLHLETKDLEFLAG